MISERRDSTRSERLWRIKKYGGYSAAAGLSLSTVEDLNEFTKVINNIVKRRF